MAKTKGRRETFSETAARRKKEKAKEADALNLKADLRAFAAGRPEGWGHDDWLAFLEHLAQRGHDTESADEIGEALERERLAVVLEQVQGMGPRRVDSVVNRFGSVWHLSQASVEDVCSLPSMPRSLAERVLESVRQQRI
jgi:hypothetical protein